MVLPYLRLIFVHQSLFKCQSSTHAPVSPTSGLGIGLLLLERLLLSLFLLVRGVASLLPLPQGQGLGQPALEVLGPPVTLLLWCLDLGIEKGVGIVWITF